MKITFVSLMVFSIFTSCTNVQENPRKGIPVRKYKIFEGSNLITGLQEFDYAYKKETF